MRLRMIMTGLLIAAVLGSIAQASPRPFSRQDALAQQLAGQRPMARPVHMLRYPVMIATRVPVVRPAPRDTFQPRARWDFKDVGPVWTRAALAAIAAHAEVLTAIVPRDIEVWCPGYAAASPGRRRAFWVGMMSALSKHESTYRPEAVGGGDLWYGLLQIYPDTARRYGCRAQTGEALKDPAENLSCAARIMAVTVPRDRAIAVHDGRWRGVAADWGPMTNRSKIAEMAAWTSRQSYCVPIDGVRPVPRPEVMPPHD